MSSSTTGALSQSPSGARSRIHAGPLHTSELKERAFSTLATFGACADVWLHPSSVNARAATSVELPRMRAVFMVLPAFRDRVDVFDDPRKCPKPNRVLHLRFREKDLTLPAPGSELCAVFLRRERDPAPQRCQRSPITRSPSCAA